MTVPGRLPLASRGARLDADVQRILDAVHGQGQPAINDPILIVTIGLPGSGKSTFARRLAPRIDAVVLESDALRRLLFGEPSYMKAESRRLFAALSAAARQLLTQGHSVIIDSTSLKESDRAAAYLVAKEARARVLSLHFVTPEPVVERRLARRAEVADSADVSPAGLDVYRRMAEQEEPPLREHWRIDTSDAAAVEAALSRVVEACRPQAGRITGGTR